MEFPILVRGYSKDTVERYNIETLFIIIERYVKLYILRENSLAIIYKGVSHR